MESKRKVNGASSVIVDDVDDRVSKKRRMMPTVSYNLCFVNSDRMAVNGPSALVMDWRRSAALPAKIFTTATLFGASHLIQTTRLTAIGQYRTYESRNASKYQR